MRNTGTTGITAGRARWWDGTVQPVSDAGRGTAAPASEGGSCLLPQAVEADHRHGCVLVRRAGTAFRVRGDASAHPWSPHPKQGEVTPAPTSCPLGAWQELMLRHTQLQLVKATSAPRCHRGKPLGPGAG